ncbi:threonine/serine exporter family protein [Clostridium septicum]|uniref:threonine/serine exporter family protein n=1 Tax=Clostridium septicum TaxID=1504 RepID=UPI000835E198|nr:threonine/serine exporter family protein [Clostridium septicum]
MDINQILYVAMYAGKIMLESGAETYRVEETIDRICKSYGIAEVDSYATPTVIIVSVYSKGHTSSLVRRISSISVDLNKIDMVNNLSRNIERENLSIYDLEDRLKIIESKERYSFKITLLFSALGAFGFVFLFGGSFVDAISAFFIGFIVKYVTIKGSEIKINPFFINSISAGVLAFFAILSVKIGLASDIDKVIIGSIMLLVPGLSITNAIRDTVAGDLVSGLARGTDAFLTAIAIAIGTGTVLSLWINIFGGL